MIDAQVLKYLPDQYKERLVKFEKTFSSEGFPLLIQWAEKMAEEQRDRMLFAKTWDEFLILQSRWYVYTELTRIQEETLKEFELIARGVKDAQMEEVEIEYE